MVEAVGGESDGSCLLLVLAAAVLLVAWPHLPVSPRSLPISPCISLYLPVSPRCSSSPGSTPPHSGKARGSGQGLGMDADAGAGHMVMHVVVCTCCCVPPCYSPLATHSLQVYLGSHTHSGILGVPSHHDAYVFRYVTPPRSLLNTARLLGCRLRFCDSVY
jgi:hypothetical protein